MIPDTKEWNWKTWSHEAVKAGRKDVYKYAEEIAIDVGKMYMQGKIDYTHVFTFLQQSTWPFPGWTKTARLVEKGCMLAECPQGSRVQPEQDAHEVAVIASRKKKRGKITR